MKLPGPAYRQAGTPLGRDKHAGASRQHNIILYCAPSPHAKRGGFGAPSGQKGSNFKLAIIPSAGSLS